MSSNKALGVVFVALGALAIPGAPTRADAPAGELVVVGDGVFTVSAPCGESRFASFSFPATLDVGGGQTIGGTIEVCTYFRENPAADVGALINVNRTHIILDDGSEIGVDLIVLGAVNLLENRPDGLLDLALNGEGTVKTFRKGREVKDVAIGAKVFVSGSVLEKLVKPELGLGGGIVPVEADGLVYFIEH